jgi:serralysin
VNSLAKKSFALFSGDGGSAALFGPDYGGAPVAQAPEASLPGFASAPSDDIYPRADVAAADTSGDTSAATAKPVATIAQLADYLVNGFWQDNRTIAHHWASHTISYNIDGLNPAEQFLAQSALKAWSEVANVTFVQFFGGTANITFNHNGSMTAVTSAGWNGLGQITSATVDISADWITNDGGAMDGKTGIDSYGYQTYIHEIGHALGLGHQGPYNGSATYSVNAIFADDTWQYSIMSYFSEANFSGSTYRYVTTPQMADIYAVDSIYGAATTRPGDTVYGFNNTAGPIFNFNAYSPAPALTIYDSGGNDTLDCSGYSAAQTINLHPGSFSSVGGLINNIGIATNANIENAIGGSGNDTLIASDLGCTLQGRGGNDTLIGGAGNDRLICGSGIDVMSGGAGADTFVFAIGDSSPAAGQHDRITDFVSGVDHIDLTGIDAISGSGVYDAFRFIGSMAFDGTPGVLNYIYDGARGATVLEGDTNGDKVADFAIDLSGFALISTADLIGVNPYSVLIEGFGATSLAVADHIYYLLTGGSGPSLKYFGATIGFGESGASVPISAERTATGYEVAWKATGADQYVVWNTDADGNFQNYLTGVVSGSSLALESLETTFQQDLNSDGIVGIPFIEGFGSTGLAVADHIYYLLSGGSGPSLKYFGATIGFGESGASVPISAERTATGYEVAWKATGADQYVVWNTDADGNFLNYLTGVVSGSSLALESLEPTFHQDFNSDGILGIPFIEGFGSTGLAVADHIYYLLSGGSGPSLKYFGAPVTFGQSGAFAPIAAERTATGYDVAWKAIGADQYTVWSTDAAGNYSTLIAGAVPGSSLELKILEPTFQQDLNGDGVIGAASAVIEGFGATSLTVAGHIYYLLNGGSGPSLKYFGATVGFGETGTSVPIAAEQTATGYDVAWKAIGTDQYTVWSTDAGGNYVSNLAAGVPGSSLDLKILEPTFQQDLNGDGVIGTASAVIEGFGTTSLTVAGHIYYLTSGGSGPSLKYFGATVGFGETGSFAPIAAEQTATGYDVAWKAIGADQYLVWSTDAAGNFLSYLTGVVPGNSSDLKSLEGTFHQDLNGDGVAGVPVAAATIGAAAMPASDQFVFGATVVSNAISNGSSGIELDHLFSASAANNSSAVPLNTAAAGQPQSLLQQPAGSGDTAIDAGHYDGLPANVHIADLIGHFII